MTITKDCGIDFWCTFLAYVCVCVYVCQWHLTVVKNGANQNPTSKSPVITIWKEFHRFTLVFVDISLHYNVFDNFQSLFIRCVNKMFYGLRIYPKINTESFKWLCTLFCMKINSLEIENNLKNENHSKSVLILKLVITFDL